MTIKLGVHMEDIARMAQNLEMLEEGFWISRDAEYVSYPKRCHAAVLDIERQSFWFQHRNQCILEVLRRFPPGGTIFDIGGGNGHVSLYLKHNGFETVLVEPGIEGTRNAKARGISPVICASLNTAGFHDNSLSAVGIFDVLEHVEDDGAFLRTIKRILAPGGRLYITVPAYNALWSLEDNLAGHYRRYSLKGIVDMLRSFGFLTEYSTHFFAVLVLPIWLLRTLPSMIGMRKKYIPERYKIEHCVSGTPARLLNACLHYELTRIKRDRVTIGTSLLLVARATVP